MVQHAPQSPRSFRCRSNSRRRGCAPSVLPESMCVRECACDDEPEAEGRSEFQNDDSGEGDARRRRCYVASEVAKKR